MPPHPWICDLIQMAAPSAIRIRGSTIWRFIRKSFLRAIVVMPIGIPRGWPSSSERSATGLFYDGQVIRLSAAVVAFEILMLRCEVADLRERLHAADGAGWTSP